MYCEFCNGPNGDLAKERGQKIKLGMGEVVLWFSVIWTSIHFQQPKQILRSQKREVRKTCTRPAFQNLYVILNIWVWLWNSYIVKGASTPIGCNDVQKWNPSCGRKSFHFFFIFRFSFGFEELKIWNPYSKFIPLLLDFYIHEFNTQSILSLSLKKLHNGSSINLYPKLIILLNCRGKAFSYSLTWFIL